MRPPTSHESRFIGRVLRDKWRIDSKIARGGMGTVFVARHKNNGSTAAIKILNAEFARDEDTKSRFMQEGYAANQVNHPGVVRILDDDVTEDGFAYLVMELLEGELLEQRRIRKGGKLELDEVYEIADQLLDVLAAAHAKGIVHRDVKPDNLFITREEKLKVLDFGFAQMKSSYRKENTATGFLIGTPGFMAPEQAMGSRALVDAQTDIWAVGATMFLLLSGQPCHAGDSPAEMLALAANFPVRSITTLEPRLPTKLSFAIDKALAFKKSDRWPDARSMQAALRAVPGRRPKPVEPSRRSFADIPPDVRKASKPPAIGAPPALPATVPAMNAVSVPPTNAAAVSPKNAVTAPAMKAVTAPAVLAPKIPRGLAVDAPLPAEDETFSDNVQEVDLDDLDRTDESRAVLDPLDAPPPSYLPPLPSEPPPSSEEPRTLFAHPASNEKPTRIVAPEPPTISAAAPVLPRLDGSPSEPPIEGTVVMESRPLTTVPRTSSPDLRSLPTTPRAFPPASSPVYPPPESYGRASSPMFPPHSTRPAQLPVARSGGGSRVLMFFLVVGITMVVVILTGLLVILGMD